MSDPGAPLGLGAFSVSLSVADLAASRAFYERLGFVAFGGDPEQNWLMMRNGDAVIGLFQGMFEGNILTFNPGWTAEGVDVDGAFDDVRTVQKRLRDAGIEPISTTDESGSGPGHLTLVDPDGNSILIDQHR
ncbi:VOC family protein [Microbacterium hominis]|uniref:VOC family protein n=1 Tax=Microbacterium hominis TaxID=162426 RepID=A0A7D4TGA1_9MICO|nr:VOC family protein [Microbacterium hominis]QKJ19161.1 VOC family protein [Microbacterium hominis]